MLQRHFQVPTTAARLSLLTLRSSTRYNLWLGVDADAKREQEFGPNYMEEHLHRMLAEADALAAKYGKKDANYIS